MLNLTFFIWWEKAGFFSFNLSCVDLIKFFFFHIQFSYFLFYFCKGYLGISISTKFKWWWLFSICFLNIFLEFQLQHPLISRGITKKQGVNAKMLNSVSNIIYQSTLFQSSVWIGMKVFGADSIILVTRKVANVSN